MIFKSFSTFVAIAAVSTTAGASTLITDFDGNGVLPVTGGTVVAGGFTGTSVAELSFTTDTGFDQVAQTNFNFGLFTTAEQEAVFTSIGSAAGAAAAGDPDQAFFLDFSFDQTASDPGAGNLISIAFFSTPTGFFQISESVSISGETGGTAVFTLNETDGALIGDAISSGFFNLEIFSNRFAAGDAGTLQVDNFSVGVVPEPGSAALLGLGAIAMLRRRAAKD
ncbi:MAG: PEP-CTERM sorting domain-containing protein [Planctomycetota bacterium]